MNLYLLRHGIAGARGDSRYSDDSQRPLTPEGRRKMRRIAAGLRALDLECDVLLSSPYVRARQTAEIAAAALRVADKLQWVDELAPDGDACRLIGLLQDKHAAAENVLLVGHEPYLGNLIGVLLAGQASLPVGLKKGGLCLLSVAALAVGPCAALEWLLTPRQLVKLGG